MLIACLTMAGCSSIRYETEFPGFAERAADESVELSETPFFPQDAYQCGPAALATVLTVADIKVSPADLTPKIYLPARKGSLQVELIAAVRRYGLLPYPLDPGPEALLAEIKAGRPVLVLQNLGFASYPVWHYAVVIGYDPGAAQFILRSGTEKRKLMSLRAFLHSWRGSKYWGLVILHPGELPVKPRESAYLQTVVALESSGQLEPASTAYAAGLQQWPDNAALMLGLGNVYHAQRKLVDAERVFREFAERHPQNAVAYNNLAQVLAERGCYQAATKAIASALDIADPQDSLYRVYQRTQKEITNQQRVSRNSELTCR